MVYMPTLESILILLANYNILRLIVYLMTLDDFGAYELPPIYVSDPGFDDMGEFLDQLGISYRGIEQADLGSMEDGVVMINCDAKWQNGAIGVLGKAVDATTDASSFESLIKGATGGNSVTNSLDAFIKRGGAAIVSDYAGELLTEFTAASFDTSTNSKSVTASVEDSELADLLGENEVGIEFDLGGWYKPRVAPRGNAPLLRDALTGDLLAYKFSHGKGDIVYTAFHNHAQATEVEEALLTLLLMIPIAETTGNDLKDTYTTITGENIQSGNTVLQDTAKSSTSTTTTTESSAELASLIIELDIFNGGTISEGFSVGDSVQFGRDDFAGHIPDEQRQYISGTHFEVSYRDDGTIEIRDTNSSNGTQLNGRDISDSKPRELSDGAEIDLADGSASVVVWVS